MRLLLTVTGPGEVPTALEAGADLVDVKDPRRGSLGPPARPTLRRVARRLSGRAPLGVPLGDGPHRAEVLASRAAAAARAGAGYLKVGLLERALAGRPDPAEGGPPPAPGLDPPAALAAARRAAAAGPAPCVLMAVTFADAPAVSAPSPEEAVGIAASAGVDGVMLDTVGKEEGSVVAALGRERIRRWCRSARSHGLATALAGGLDAAGVAGLRGTGVDVVGVRGGACAGGREGRLDPGRCRALRRAVDRVAGGAAGRAAGAPGP